MVCVHCFRHISAFDISRVTVAFEAVCSVAICVNGAIRFIILVVAHNQKLFHHLIRESHQLIKLASKTLLTFFVLFQL